MEYIVTVLAVGSFIVSLWALSSIHKVIKVQNKVFEELPEYELPRKTRSDKGKKRGAYKKGKK